MASLPSSDRKCRRSPSPRTPLLSRRPSAGGDGGCRLVFTESEPVADASYSGAVFNLSTTIIGAGIMALPATLKQLGLIPGLIMIVLGAILTNSSIQMILKLSRASRSDSYSSLVEDSFGVWGRRLLQGCVIINNFGLLIVYMIIIGDVLSGSGENGVHHSGLIEEWLGRHWWSSRASLLFVTTIFIFAPLISLRQIDSLRYTSAVSVGLAVVFVVITALIVLVKLANGSIAQPRLMPELDSMTAFWQLFTTIPVLVTAYICHHNVHPIRNELMEPSQMRCIVRSSLVLCAIVYIATSLFGYLLFGDETMDDVLANFDGDLRIPYSSVLDDLVRASYGVHLMLVFPIVFFSLRINLHGFLYPHSLCITSHTKRFVSITVILMTLIFIGASCVPNIWVVFEFTGATVAVSVGFIFPAAVALKDPHGVATQKDKSVALFLILLSIVSSVVAVSTVISGMVSHKGF